MATNNQTSSIAAEVKQMREILSKVFDADKVEKEVQEFLAGKREPARKALTGDVLTYVQRALDLKEHTENRELLAGGTFRVEITFDQNGEPTVSLVVRKKGKRKGNTGKRPVLVSKGLTFRSYADVCRALELEVGSDSARRVYETARAKDTNLPDVVEIDSDEFAANEAEYVERYEITGEFESK